MKLDKWTVILVLGIVAIIVIVWLGIENKWFSPRTSLNLKAGEGDVKQDDGKVSAEYTRIAQNAHDQILGWNWNFINVGGQPAWVDVIEQLYILNDNELRVVVNEYDRLFDDSTLRNLINNEQTGCNVFLSHPYWTPEDPCYKYTEVKKRLNQINA